MIGRNMRERGGGNWRDNRGKGHPAFGVAHTRGDKGRNGGETERLTR